MEILEKAHRQYKFLFLAVIFYGLIYIVIMYVLKNGGTIPDIRETNDHPMLLYSILFVVSFLIFIYMLYFDRKYIKKIRAEDNEVIGKRLLGLCLVTCGFAHSPMVYGLLLFMLGYNEFEVAVFFVISLIFSGFAYKSLDYWKEKAAMILSQNDENI